VISLFEKNNTTSQETTIPPLLNYITCFSINLQGYFSRGNTEKIMYTLALQVIQWTERQPICKPTLNRGHMLGAFIVETTIFFCFFQLSHGLLGSTTSIPEAYLQFVMHCSAISSNIYCCPNLKHWKWIGVMESLTQKFCSISLLFFQGFDHGAALKIEL